MAERKPRLFASNRSKFRLVIRGETFPPQLKKVQFPCPFLAPPTVTLFSPSAALRAASPCNLSCHNRTLHGIHNIIMEGLTCQAGTKIFCAIRRDYSFRPLKSSIHFNRGRHRRLSMRKKKESGALIDQARPVCNTIPRTRTVISKETQVEQTTQRVSSSSN